MQYIFRANITNYFNVEHDIRDIFEKVGEQPFNVEYSDAAYVRAAGILIERQLFLHYCRPYEEVLDAATILKMLCEYLGKTQEQLVESILQERQEFESINKAIKEYEEKYGKKFTTA